MADFFKVLASYMIAVIRLLFITVTFFITGLQQVLFTRMEIVAVRMRGIPLRCDRDEIYNKLSFIDKLRVENPDLTGLDIDEDEMEEIDNIEEDEDEDE